MYGLHLNPYTVQCRSYSGKTVNQLYNYSTVLGAAIKCKQYSEITVESGTHVKSVKITLNIFTVYTANAYRQTTDKLMFKSVISTVRWIRK